MNGAPADHIHISEREADGTWEDCTWDSGLEWYRLTYDPRKPATHSEAQLLRRASGEPATGGSNLEDLARGIKVRYGVTIPARIHGFSALQTALTPGKSAVVQGSMSAFGPLHRLSVYDRNFDGAHAVHLMNIGGTLLWCDPEAPTSADVPVTVTWAEVKLFVNAFAGAHVVRAIRNLAPAGEAMYPIIDYLAGSLATIAAGSNIRSEPRIASTKLDTTSTALNRVIIGTVKGDVDPANGSNIWYMWYSGGRYAFTAKGNITKVVSPAAGPSYPDVRPELAECQAALTAKTAEAKAATAIVEAQKEVILTAANFKAAHKAFIDS